MAVRLRYLAHDLEVPMGEFLIGRTSDCQLSLDDALVSRRHALLTVEPEGVFIEDLGSRNGVFVNGARITSVTRIHDGDALRVGSQELRLFGIEDEADQHPASRPKGSKLSTTMQDVRLEDLIPSDTERAAASRLRPPAKLPDPKPSDARAPETKPQPQPPSQQPRTRSSGRMTTPQPYDLQDDDENERTGVIAAAATDAGKRVHGLSLIGSVADKALAMGRAEEAERILQRALNDVLTRAPTGEIQPELAEKAVAYAIRLAGATGRGVWINYTFELYTILRMLLPGRLVDELYAVARKVKSTDKGVLRAYTACLREISNGFGPAERFIQQRIESFERWAP